MSTVFLSTTTVYDDVNNATTDTNDVSQVVTSLRRPYIEIPFLFFAIIVGTVGNSLILGAIIIESRLRFPVRVFIANIATADLLVTAVVMPTMLANVFNRYANTLEGANWICNILSFVTLLSCQSSVCSLFFIGVERYTKVFINKKYNFVFSRRNTCIMTAFCWIFGFTIDIPLITGWRGSPLLVGYDKDFVLCTWSDSQLGYNLFMFAVSVILPLIITSCIYIHIFIRFRNVGGSRSRAQSIQSDMSSSVTESRKGITSPNAANSVKSKFEWQSDNGSMTSPSGRGSSDNVRTHHSRVNSFTSHYTAKLKRMVERERVLHATLFAVLVFYIAFWMPYILVSVTPGRYQPGIKRATGWLALSNSIVNFFIYGVLNQNFRRAYRRVLVKIKTSIMKPVIAIMVAFKLKNAPEDDGSENSDGVQHSVKFTV